MKNNPNLDFYGFGEPLEPSDAPAAQEQQEPIAEASAPQAEEQALARRQQAKQAFSRLGFGVAVLVVGWYVAVFLVQSLLLAINPALADNTSLIMLSGTVPLYAIGLPLLFLVIRKQPRALPQQRAAGAQIGLVFFIAMFTMIAGALFSNLLMSLLGALRGEPYVNDLDAILGMPLPLVFVLTVICAPIFEELICRKLLLERALPFGELPAILFTSTVFALIHGNFFQFFYAFLLGVIFSYVYLRTGKLRYTIGLHMVLNFIGGVLPAIIMQRMDVNELLRLAEQAGATGATGETGEMAEYFLFIMENMPALVLQSYLLVLQYGGALVGLILLLTFRRRITLEQREGQLKRGQYRVMFLQAGGVTMLVVLGALMVISLFR